jgi:hypothetical protein
MNQNAEKYYKKISYASDLLGCTDKIINFSIKIVRLSKNTNGYLAYMWNWKVRLII